MNIECPSFKPSSAQALSSSVPAGSRKRSSSSREARATMKSNVPHNNNNPSGGNGDGRAQDQASPNQLRFAGDANSVSGRQQLGDPSKPCKNEIAGEGCINIKKPSYPPVTHRPAAQPASQPAQLPVPPLVHQPSLTANLNNFQYHTASYPTIGSGKLVDMQKQKLDKQAAKKSELSKRAVIKNQLANEEATQQEQPENNQELPKTTQDQQLSNKEAPRKKRQEAHKKKPKDHGRKEIKGKQEELVRHHQTRQHTQPQTQVLMQHPHPQMVINQPYNHIIHPQSLQHCYPAQQYATQCFPIQQYTLQPNMMYNLMAFPQQQYPTQYPAQPIMNSMMSFIQPQLSLPHTVPLAVSLPALTSKEDTTSELKKKKKKKKKKLVKNSTNAKSDKENPNNENEQDESVLTMPPLPPLRELMTSPTLETDCDTFDYEKIHDSPEPEDQVATPLARELMPSPNSKMVDHSFVQNEKEESSQMIMASLPIDLNTVVVNYTTDQAKHPPFSMHPSLVSTKDQLIHKSTTEGTPHLSAPEPSAPAPSAPVSSAPAPSAPVSSAPEPSAPAPSAPAPSASAPSAPASPAPAPPALAPKNERDDSPDSWNEEVADQVITEQSSLPMKAANAMVQTNSVKDAVWDDDNYVKCNESTDDQDSTALRENLVDQANLDHVMTDSEAASFKYPSKSAIYDSADGFAMLYCTRKVNCSPLLPDTPSVERGKLCGSAIIQERSHHPSVDYTARPQSEITSTSSMKSSKGIISDDEEAAALKNPPNCVSSDIATDQDLSTPPTATYPTDEVNLTSTEGDCEKAESSRAEGNPDPASNKGISEETFKTNVELDYVSNDTTEPRHERQRENEIHNAYSELNSNNDTRNGDDYEEGSIMSSPRASSEDTPDTLLSQVSRNAQTGTEGVQRKSLHQVTQPVDTDAKKVTDSKQNVARTKTTFDSNLRISSSEDSIEDEDDDLSWECMLMQLEAYRQRFGDLSVPFPQKNEENTTQSGWYHLYVWVRNQRQKLSEGSLLPERSQKLRNLGLDLNPKQKHSGATQLNHRRASKRKKKELKNVSNKSEKISGPKAFAISLTSKVTQKSLPTKPPLGQRNETPQTPSQQPTNVTNGPSMLAGNNFMAHNLQQLMPSPFQQRNNSTQFITSQQSLQQMQPSCQQFNNTAHAQYPVISAGHYEPMMNALQPQIGQHIPVQGPYQQADDRAVQLSGMNNSTHHSHIQQASEFQALQAPYQQFHNTMAPQFTSSINDAEPQSQQTSPHDKQLKLGHRPSNATASVSKSKHQLHTMGRTSTVQPKEHQSHPSRPACHDHTQSQQQKFSKLKNKGLQESQVNLVVASHKNETETSSFLSDEAKEKRCISNKADELRSGKFSREEEEYCLAVINDFKLGLLDALPGQNICSYLAKKLGCTYLRISKKFHGIVNLPPFAPISIKGSDEKTEQEVANARKRMKALYKKFWSSESVKAKPISSPDKPKTPNAESNKRASSIEAEERPAKKLKHRPLEEQAKEAQGKREKAESLMKAYKGTTESTHALAASRSTHNLFAPQHQFQMSFNPLSAVFQQNFLQAQLHANTSNYRLQQAQNLDLIQKAMFCQVNAYSGMNGMSQQPAVMTPSQGHESLKATVESAEKDIAAETLCAIRNTGKEEDE